MNSRSISTFARLSFTGAVSVAALCLAVSSAHAGRYCKGPDCTTQTRGQMLDNATTINKQIGANTEAQSPGDANEGGYSISVDGEVVAGSAKLADKQRKEDKRLDAVDIQVKFDGLGVKPMLNVSTVPVRQSYQAGEQVNFLASTNYPDWVKSAEIRLFEKQASLKSTPLAQVPLTEQGIASWAMPAKGPAELVYVLRVYDAEGRFDETKPLDLRRSDAKRDQHAPQDAAVAPGYAEDATAFRNIPVSGGAVTVFGQQVPQQDHVAVMGRMVPIDPEGKFVTQVILPSGSHQVSVKVLDDKRKGLEFNRDINIPSSEWFYVGLADFTAGKRFGSDAIVAARPGDFDGVYTRGRLAFYLKGKIKGDVLLTAAADTGENELKNLLQGMDGKDTQQFLKRIDPNKYYPVYGDDSTTIEDAPTRGKFYVRLEKGDSHVMWGNFKTEITGTRFMRNERALYGASAVYKSPSATSNGDRHTQLQAYAALPGTLPQRDLLRGTGGSAYFLKQQDITVGSETATIEIHDAVTDAVISRQPLKYGVDYSFDYIQGVIILNQPLQSTSSAGAVVGNGTSGGNPAYLALSYEYTPAAGTVDGYSGGGRAQQWLGDHVRFGVSGAREKTGGADQTAYGADVRVQQTPNTYVQAEVAHSEGPGFGQNRSTDGGLTISSIGTSGSSNVPATAYHIEGQADLADLSHGAARGTVGAHFTHQDGGFSSLDEQVTTNKDDWGTSVKVNVGEKSDLVSTYTEQRIAGGAQTSDAETHADIAVGHKLTVSPGVRYSNKLDPSLSATDVGARTDLGLRVSYGLDDTHSVYGFGQGTVMADATRRLNNRIGAGAVMPLTEKSDLTSELSYGSSGIGGVARIDYRRTADDTYYFGYVLDPDRQYGLGLPLTGEDLGKAVAGSRHRFSDELSMFAEDSYDMFGAKRTLAQTYGVNYTPDATWSYGANAELGHIADDTINPSTLVKNSDFNRVALSGSVGYKDQGGNTGRIKGEVRVDRSDDGTRNVNSYLMSDSLTLKANADWRFLANLDVAFSEASDSTRNSAYIQGTLGYAYRPINNDRLNALFKYVYLYDLPGADQVTVTGSASGLQQRSHILSADANYDLTQTLTVGAKYGFRIGDSRPRDGSSDWTTSSAHLGIIRADYNIVHQWDALVEGRVLWQPVSDTTDLGLLVAAYRHVGENFKVGVGYNFGRFSDDLRDQSMDNHGVFINLVGQF